MDLITQLISAKKNTNAIDFVPYLKELIKYDKLSRSKKFQHITESPLLQKQLPLCWAAFSGDAHSFWMLNEAAMIMQTVSNRPLLIFTDLANRYSHKKQMQLEVIGNVAKYYVFYHDLTMYYPDTDENLTYLFDDESETYFNLSIIKVNEKSATIFSGQVKKNLEEVEDEKIVVKPYVLKTPNDSVTIKTYSVQGNNDYDFANTKYYRVSMNDSDTFVYTSKATGQQKVVKMVLADEQELTIRKADVKVMANMIAKYLPEPENADKAQAMKESLQQQRIIGGTADANN